jgi:hypothetical protein
MTSNGFKTRFTENSSPQADGKVLVGSGGLRDHAQWIKDPVPKLPLSAPLIDELEPFKRENLSSNHLP